MLLHSLVNMDLSQALEMEDLLEELLSQMCPHADVPFCCYSELRGNRNCVLVSSTPISSPFAIVN